LIQKLLQQPTTSTQQQSTVDPILNNLVSSAEPITNSPPVQKEPTTQPLQLTDFFGTPEPRLVKDNKEIEVVPVELDISELTGAVPIGVSWEKSKRKGVKKPSKVQLKTRGKLRKRLRGRNNVDSDRRKKSMVAPLLPPDTKDKKPLIQETQRSSLRATLVPPRRRNNFVRRKRNKARVATVERYKYENEDGSITWGYQNDDGTFKEETIGTDCITHGKYGYIDSNGEKREYSYSSGVRCDPDTRKVKVNSSGDRDLNGKGYFDYGANKFVLPNGRRVTVVVNQRNKARGAKY